MCLLDLKTLSLGRSLVPITFLRTRAFLLCHPVVFIILPLIYFPPAFPALPAFLLITSSEYLMPLPLYGSGGLIDLMSAATCPTTCLSGPFMVTMVCFSTVAVTPLGSSYFIGWE